MSEECWVSCAPSYEVGPYYDVARKRVLLADPDEVAENIAEKLVTGKGLSDKELLEQALLAIERLTVDVENAIYDDDTRW